MAKLEKEKYRERRVINIEREEREQNILKKIIETCYKTIIYLGWYCCAIVKFFTIGRWAFWYFDTKIFEIGYIDALRVRLICCNKSCNGIVIHV